MAHQDSPDQPPAMVVVPVSDAGADGAAGEEEPGRKPVETVEQPAKIMRIGSMTKQLLEEVRHAPLDEAGRSRLAEIYESAVSELTDSLSEDLRTELGRLALPFAGPTPPSEAELRVAQAQLVGWLEGLFHGIQATLFAQQMAAHNQLEELRRRSLPAAPDDARPRPGTYL